MVAYDGTSGNPFPDDGAQVLIANWTFCHDSRQVVCFLRLFIEMAATRTSPYVASDATCRLLYFQIRPLREAQFSLALEVLCLISGESLWQHIHAVMLRMNPIFFTPELF
jgi:hypothetical protein